MFLCINDIKGRASLILTKPLPLGGPTRQVSYSPKFLSFKQGSGVSSFSDKGRVGRYSAYSQISTARRTTSRLVSLSEYLNDVAIFFYTHLKDLEHTLDADHLYSKGSLSVTVAHTPSDMILVVALCISYGGLSVKKFYTTRHSARSDRSTLQITHADLSVNFLFKEDINVVSKPRDAIYKDRNEQKKMMQETEVHKFSDGTLCRIQDKLDYKVKDF
ncbi:hypothetical protein Tco_0246388 [Tanacetum coccineum]